MRFLLLLGVWHLASISTAHAAIFTFIGEGEITAVPTGLSTEFTVGESFKITFEVGSDVDQESSTSAIGRYALGQTLFEVGDYVATSGVAGGNFLDIQPFQDAFQLNAQELSGPPVGGFELRQGILNLFGTAQPGPYVNDSLPMTPPDIAVFNEREMSLLFGASNDLQARLDSVIDQDAVVPLPASGVLLMCALVALGVAAHAPRRRRHLLRDPRDIS